MKIIWITLEKLYDMKENCLYSERITQIKLKTIQLSLVTSPAYLHNYNLIRYILWQYINKRIHTVTKSFSSLQLTSSTINTCNNIRKTLPVSGDEIGSSIFDVWSYGLHTICFFNFLIIFCYIISGINFNIIKFFCIRYYFQFMIKNEWFPSLFFLNFVTRVSEGRV